jgi:dolichol-phosphate mannosyltransferase
MASTRPLLSLVIPIFNEELIIEELNRRLITLLARLEGTGFDTEVIFVDDGSTDASLRGLRELALAEPRYRVLSFSRNFGHQIAITAGVDRADGDAVVVMDADLQDPPEVIELMVQRWREGYDVVYGVRRHRAGETLFKKATAKLFYRTLRRLTGVAIPLDAGDFRLMSRPVVLTLRTLREKHRFVRGLVAWIGFRQVAVEYERHARFAGTTKYPLRKMLKFATDGITSFSIVPLRLATWIGLFGGVASIVVGLWALYTWQFRHVVQGWTTVVVLSSFGFSVQLLVTGILGEYLGRIYEEMKRRPMYIIAEEVNLGKSEKPRRLSPEDRWERTG